MHAAGKPSMMSGPAAEIAVNSQSLLPDGAEQLHKHVAEPLEGYVFRALYPRP